MKKENDAEKEREIERMRKKKVEETFSNKFVFVMILLVFSVWVLTAQQ